MLGAFYAYAAVLLCFKDTRCLLYPSPRQWRKIMGLALLPWFSMLGALMLCLGPVVLQGVFWAESFKDIPRWLNGADAVPIFSCLRDRNFFAFFSSFALPLIYAAGMAATISMVCFRRWTCEKLLMIPLGVYGLGVYAHFLWHSTIDFYYMSPLPLVGCICFWTSQCLEGLPIFRQRLVKMILTVTAVIALFTNVLFTNYPNIFDLARVNWDQQKDYYRTNFNFKKDASFVWYWTKPDQPVPLISGFATQILLQADRKPFFNNGLTLMGQDDLAGLARQLDGQKPGQVFIDKRTLNITGNAAFDTLMNYIKAHYQYSGEQSDSLVLLRSLKSRQSP